MPELVGSKIGPIGLGLMGLTARANPCPQEQAFDTLRTALEQGNNFWNGGEFYGPPNYNSLVLLERYFERFPEDAEKVVLSIKGGGEHAGTFVPDGSAKNTRRTIDDSIAQLKGRKKIDMFEFGRRDPRVPMEVTLEVIQKEYIETGKIGGVALSEVRAETIHEAVKHVKVVAVEVEVSLFSPGVLHNGVAAACAKYDIPIIAYSPLGRGMLTGRIKDLKDLPNAHLQQYPWFQPGNFEINLQLVEKAEKLAERKGCTPSQLAINWVRALSYRPGMPTIVPIPGATTTGRVEENGRLIDLSKADMDEIDEILAKFETAGGRYPDSIPTDT